MSEEPAARDAAEALRLIRSERQRVATTVLTEARWYAPADGAVVGAAVLVLSAPWRWVGLGGVAVVLAFVALMAAYRRTTGLWVSAAGPEAPRGQVVAVVLLLVAGVGVALLSRHVWHLPAVAVAAAVLTGAGAAVLSRSFDRAYARRLARG